MTVDTLVARLPDELIVEVFRKRVLRPRDLAKCALVSRRLVQVVQETLYKTVDIAVFDSLKTIDELLREGYSNPHRQVQYTEDPWKLLGTLMKDKTLTNLIMELNFVIIKQVPSGYLPDSPSSVRDATPWDTLSAFLKLAPNTKRASFGHRWAIQVDELSLLACSKKITGLSISSLEEEEVYYLPEAFLDLKHLELHSLDLFSWPDTNLEKPKGLETLFLHDEIPELSLPFVLATSQTLRFLGVSVFIASALDFTQLTHLQDLTVYPVSDELEEEDIAHLAGGGPGFWPAICGCPTLATLTFLFRAPQWNRDDGLTAALSRPPTRIEKAIPTLRTIQFQENVFLDRARFLLSSTLSASLVRFIIPSTLTSQEASRQDKVTYKAVLAMCDEVGVEVYLADE